MKEGRHLRHLGEVAADTGKLPPFFEKQLKRDSATDGNTIQKLKEFKNNKLFRKDGIEIDEAEEQKKCEELKTGVCPPPAGM